MQPSNKTITMVGLLLLLALGFIVFHAQILAAGAGLIASLDGLSLQISQLAHHTVAVQPAQAQTRTVIILPNGDQETVSASDWRETWAVDFLNALGIHPTRRSVDMIVAWTKAEDRGEDAHSRFNPLNTTRQDGSIGEINSAHVRIYPDYQTGLNATASTLNENQCGYGDIREGLRAGDRQQFLNGIAQGCWGTNAKDVESLLPSGGSPSVGQVVSVPISTDGSDFGFNIQSALHANGGALMNVTIRPGETWSFNGSLGPVSNIPMRSIGEIPGAGWCDLASRYVQAARPIVGDAGLRFDNHIAQTGQGLYDVAPQDAVDIWTDGTPGFQNGNHDLWITNTTSQTLHFQVQQAGDEQVAVAAWLE